MSKLRLATERKENSNNVHNDLRGLPELCLKKHHYPWVYLVAADLNLKLRNDLKQFFNLEVKEIPSKNQVVIFDSSNNVDHKIKSVRLMGASIYLASKDQGLKMLLAQLDVLRYVVLNKDLSNLPETTTDEFKSWDAKSSGLKICMPMNIYLNHAGFSVGTTEKDLFLDLSSLGNLSIPKPVNKLRESS